MKRFFVYYDYGSCNDGSHSSGLEAFDTLEEAQDYCSSIQSRVSLEEGEMVVIHGERLLVPMEKS